MQTLSHAVLQPAHAFIFDKYENLNKGRAQPGKPYMMAQIRQRFRRVLKLNIEMNSELYFDIDFEFDFNFNLIFN